MTDFELYEPTSLGEALDLLNHDDPTVRPMGGGTALMLMMKGRFLSPTRLVSLRRVPGLGGHTLDDTGSLRIGATTTFATLEHSELIARHLPVVTGAMRDLANVRVRNVATVGGNLAHADPHLDLPPIWVALGAEAVLASRSGTRLVAVEDLTLGYYETCIADGEIICEIRVPLRPGWRSIYAKVTTRAIHDWPALGLTVSARFEADRITECRVVLSAATDRPIRLAATEAELTGSVADAGTLRLAGNAAIAEAEIESDGRGSADYKNHLLKVHLARAVNALVPTPPAGASHAVS